MHCDVGEEPELAARGAGLSESVSEVRIRAIYLENKCTFNTATVLVIAVVIEGRSGAG